MESNNINNNKEEEEEEYEDNGELNFEQYDKHTVKPTDSQKEHDLFIFNQTLKSLDDSTLSNKTTATTTTNTRTTTSTNTTTTKINSAIEITTINKNNNNDNDDISDDDDEYIKKKKQDIENISPHYSSEDEMIKFNIEDLKLFIGKLEQSNIDLALAFQDDEDPIYLESIQENIQIIEKKKKLLEELESILIKKEGLFL